MSMMRTGKLSFDFMPAISMWSWLRRHESPVRFRVLIDGHSPGPSSGADVDEQGYGPSARRECIN